MADTAFHPQTFRLPRGGERDVHFNLSRAMYYELEALGKIRMRRLLKPGKKRGTTLIDFEQVREYLRSLDSPADKRLLP
jgi:hypothetical protein